MSERDSFDKAKAAVEVLKGVISVASETPDLREAGQNLAKGVNTVTSLVNNCLLPIAAVNFAFDKGRQYFAEKFPDDVKSATKGIPQESLVEPKASVAAPVLQGLGFSHAEPDLKELYLQLLASSMDGRNPDLAHPSFAEIIRQLSAFEAHMLSKLMKIKRDVFSIANLMEVPPDKSGEIARYRHLFAISRSDDGSPFEVPSFPSIIENWRRLGLFDVDYQRHLTSDEEYAWIEMRPEYLRLVEKIGEENIRIAKGIMSQTPFGNDFASAVLGT